MADLVKALRSSMQKQWVTTWIGLEKSVMVWHHANISQTPVHMFRTYYEQHEKFL